MLATESGAIQNTSGAHLPKAIICQLGPADHEVSAAHQADALSQASSGRPEPAFKNATHIQWIIH